MSGFSRHLSAILAVSLYVVLVACLPSCGNDGPVAPIPNPTDCPNLQPAPESDNLNPTTRIHEDKPSELSMLPVDEIATTSIQDVVSAMFLLREKGGGITSVANMPPGQFAVHVWDAETAENLPAEMVVVCDGGASLYASLNGWAVFQNATFPVTVSVRVIGYAIESYVKTSGNMFSFSMDSLEIPQTSYIFGITNNLGYDEVSLLTDEITPRQIVVGPSLANPQYCRFEIPVTSGHRHGFSAFLKGAVDWGNDSDTPSGPFGPPASPMPLLWLTGLFNWSVPPLAAGVHRYYMVSFSPNKAPVGVANGLASVPSENWDDGSIVTATPTLIFYDDERYIALGPPQSVKGDAPDSLSFHCPYFEPTPTGDRMVMAGHLVTPTGATDILHMDWHTGYDSPKLEFSGVPELDVASNLDSYLPIFQWTDPLAAKADMTRIETRLDDAPIWNITMPGDVTELNSLDMSIIPVWLSTIIVSSTPVFRVLCLDTPGQGVDSFTEQQILRARREACYSSWCTEQW